MLMKPSLFDIKYDKMNSNERLFNYERDVLLYEQAQSLEQIARNSSPQQTSTGPLDPYTKLELDVATTRNHYEYGPPEYFEFNDIKDKCTTYINRINSVGAIQAIFTYILVCSVVFGVPLNFTSVPDIIKILGVASLPISIVGIIITSVLKYTQLNKAKDAEKQLAKYIYEHKNNIEEY